MATRHVEVGLEEVRIGVSAADPSGRTRTPEDVLEDLKKTIGEKDVELFNCLLAELEGLLQDDNTVVERLTASSALCKAAWVGSVPIMETLIQKGVDMNAKSRGDSDWSVEYTPLYLATVTSSHNAVRYLIDQGADVNMKSYKGETPLYVAAKHGIVDILRYLVVKGADVNSTTNRGNAPLHMAARGGNLDIISYLIDKGADFNIKDDKGWTPLHEAALKGNVDTVKYLIEKGADVNITDYTGLTPLLWACHGGSTETVKYLLQRGADPTIESKHGVNSLCWAISSRNKDIVATLLGHDKWKEMLRSSFMGTTLMRELIASMPDVAELAFNRCVTTNEGKRDHMGVEVHATSSTFRVDFNYEFLEDFQDKHSPDSAESWRPEKFTKYNHPLHLIGKHGCAKLLKHPLVINLLEQKWTRFGRSLFFGNLFIYLIFLTFLTAFSLVVLSPLEKTCVDVLNGSFNGTAPEGCEGLSIHDYRFLYVGAAVTILTASLRLAIEIIQVCRHPLEYIQDWVNWLEIPLYLFSIIFTFVFATPCLCVYSWQWQIGVVAVFLGWVGLITFLQKWHLTGVYVLMFVNVLRSFLKIAFLALLLVIAFALSFYMLLFEPDEMRTAFSRPGRAIVKVMAMITGELDYDDLYHQQEGEDEIAFPPVSFLLWIIFLVLMPVLLSNLLTGLAVGDVDRLQKTAGENRIELQIDLVLSFEELLESLGIRHRFAISECNNNYPNVPETLLPQWCNGRTSKFKLAHPGEHEKGRPAKVRKWIARLYSDLSIADEYSTSGVKISQAIKPPPDTLKKQLQKQSQQLEAKLQEQGGHQTDQLKAKLKELGEEMEEQFKADLKEYSEKHSEQFQEAVRQLSECHKEHVEEQTERSQQQYWQLENKLKEQSDQLEAKMKEHSEKLFQEAVRQLSECNKEQAKQSEEQAKKVEEQTEQLAGEVASLREALEKLVAQMAAK